MKFPLACSECFYPSSDDLHDNNGGRVIKSGLPTLQNAHVFTYNELKIATGGFRSSDKIGQGGFGSVYKGRLQDGTVVAVKVLSAESKQGDREFMSEMASISNINHENLVKLHGGCVHGARRMLVYDYMQNNSLSHTLLRGEKRRAKFSWKTRREICLGIARGLAYIHEDITPHVVHRDIKASNILLDGDFTPKISDFGLSKLLYTNITHITTRVAGTLGYLAPEYALSGHLTRKSDVYSFGVLILEIVSGRTAIDFDLDLGEHYLVQKAWELYKTKKLDQLVDPVMRGDITAKEAVRFLKVGLLCVQEKCDRRPKISKAMSLMSDDEINLDDLLISQPGIITDIMDVKLGRRRSTSQGITSTPSHRLYNF